MDQANHFLLALLFLLPLALTVQHRSLGGKRLYESALLEIQSSPRA